MSKRRTAFWGQPATCHPDRKNVAEGLCAGCRQEVKRAKPVCHPERRKTSASGSRLCVECYREDVKARRGQERDWQRAAGILRRPRGAGGITWRKRDQRWQASYTDAEGFRRYLYAPTRAIAEQRLEEIIGELPAPPIGPDGLPITRRQPGREPMSLRVRFDVLERDGFRCAYCGATPEDGAKLVVDHILPVVEGGTNSMDNLVTACHPCNAGKAHRILKVMEGGAA